MPYCPQCREEYRTEATKCAECDVALVPELPKEAEPNWVQVFAGSFADATIVRSSLEAAGIEAFVPKDSVFPDAGIDMETSYGVEVLVSEEDAAEARKILQGMDRVESEEVPPGEGPQAKEGQA